MQVNGRRLQIMQALYHIVDGLLDVFVLVGQVLLAGLSMTATTMSMMVTMVMLMMMTAITTATVVTMMMLMMTPKSRGINPHAFFFSISALTSCS